MLIIVCVLSLIACCLSTLLISWEQAMRRRRLFLDALLVQIGAHRQENQRQLQWVAAQRTRLKGEEER
jgi:hypothetical protein